MPKYLVMTLALVLACAAGLPAQNNPLSAELKRFYEGSRNNIMHAAEKVPEADYTFKLTTTVRNFGEEVARD
jgi:hypothetical protein